MDYKKEEVCTIDLSDISCNISASTVMGYNSYETDINNVSISDLTVTGSNTSPYLVTSSGTGGFEWGNLAIGNGNDPWNQDRSGKITLKGDNADIEINGASLLDMIKGIQERLNILQPNQALEAEWDQLRELGEQYRALEKKLTEQGKMWETLKKMPPPEIK